MEINLPEIISKILLELKAHTKVGVSLLELEAVAEEQLKKYEVESCNKGYQPPYAKTPFPSVLCVSLNNCIAHGYPSPYKIKEGDLVNLDLGITKYGECADAGFTVPVGEIANRDRHMIKYTKRAMYAGIRKIKAGIKVWDIGEEIERVLHIYGFVPNRVLCGHGIGSEMHTLPSVPNFKPTSEVPEQKNEILKEGQVLCIEPLVTYKDKFGFLDRDGWRVLTQDGRNSVMFEHMVRVEKDGYTILTSHFNEQDDVQ